MRTYTVVVEHDQENGSYWATVPALPGCFTQGETISEVLDRLQEAIALHLDGLRADGESIPEGDGSPDQQVRLTVTVAA